MWYLHYASAPHMGYMHRLCSCALTPLGWRIKHPLDAILTWSVLDLGAIPLLSGCFQLTLSSNKVCFID